MSSGDLKDFTVSPRDLSEVGSRLMRGGKCHWSQRGMGEERSLRCLIACPCGQVVLDHFGLSSGL